MSTCCSDVYVCDSDAAGYQGLLYNKTLIVKGVMRLLMPDQASPYLPCAAGHLNIVIHSRTRGLPVFVCVSFDFVRLQRHAFNTTVGETRARRENNVSPKGA